MSTYVQARDSLISYLDPLVTAALPTLPVFYENTTKVDLDKVGDMFIAISVVFDDAQGLEINASPQTMVWGEVIFKIFTKAGVGTRRSLEVFDALISIMKYKFLSHANTECPTPGKKVTKDGWTSADLNVPFYFIT